MNDRVESMAAPQRRVIHEELSEEAARPEQCEPGSHDAPKPRRCQQRVGKPKTQHAHQPDRQCNEEAVHLKDLPIDQ